MKKLLLCSLLLIPATALFAQDDAAVTATILHRDSLFWHDYNTCNVADMRQYLTDNVEFYHDKGGITLGSDSLMATLSRNLCKDPSRFQLRREAVAGTVKVYPMRNNGVVYGAVISGRHEFYINEPGKNEFVDGIARFTHLWLLTNGEWRMARVLSYDHEPAPYVSVKKEIRLPDDVLQSYTGAYVGPNNTITLAVENGQLTLSNGAHKMVLWPESKDHFFTKERDLTFTFGGGKLVVREHGAVAEELVRQ